MSQYFGLDFEAGRVANNITNQLQPQQQRPLQLNPQVVALARTNQLSADQQAVLSRDEYNYIYNNDQFRYEHGDAVASNIEEAVQSIVSPNAFVNDQRSLFESAIDKSLGVTQGIAQGVMGLASVLTIPGSDVSNSIARAANSFTDWTDKNIGSDYWNATKEAQSSKNPLREEFSKRQWEQNKALGDSDFTAGLKQIGNDALQNIKDIWNDNGAFERAATNALGSLAVSGPLSRGVAFAGKALQGVTKSSSLLGKFASNLAKPLAEEATFAQKVLGNSGLTNALLEVGGSVQSAVASVDAMSADELMRSPEFVQKVNEYKQQGFSNEGAIQKAKEDLTSSVARFAALITAPIAATTGAIADKTVRSPFRPITPEGTGRLKGILSWGEHTAKGAVREGFEEGMQGFQKMGENVGLKANDYDVHAWKGVGEEIATGAIAGAFSGGTAPLTGIAGNLAKTAAVIPAWAANEAWRHTTTGKRNRFNAIGQSITDFRKQINESSLPQEQKDEWNKRLDALHPTIDLSNAEVQKELKETNGQPLSSDTIKAFDSSKSIQHNLFELEEKAKALRKKDPAKAAEIYQDIYAIQAYMQEHFSESPMQEIANERDLVHIAQQAAKNQLNDSTAENEKRKALWEGLNKPSQQEQLSAAMDYVDVSNMQKRDNESVDEFEQRKEEKKLLDATSLVNTFNRLNAKNPATNESFLDDAENQQGIYDSFFSKTLRNIDDSPYNFRDTQNRYRSLVESNTSAQISNVNNQLNMLRAKRGNPDVNLLYTLSTLQQVSSTNTARDVQEATVKKLAELKQETTGYDNIIDFYSDYLSKQIEAKKAYANNPALQDARTSSKKHAEFYGNADQNLMQFIHEATKNQNLKQQLQTTKNRHNALTQALKELMQNRKANTATAQYWDEVSQREETMEISRKEIAKALAEERKLFLTYASIMGKNDADFSTDTANLTVKDFKKGNAAKATFKNSYNPLEKMQDNKALSAMQQAEKDLSAFQQNYDVFSGVEIQEEEEEETQNEPNVGSFENPERHNAQQGEEFLTRHSAIKNAIIQALKQAATQPVQEKEQKSGIYEDATTKKKTVRLQFNDKNNQPYWTTFDADWVHNLTEETSQPQPTPAPTQENTPTDQQQQSQENSSAQPEEATPDNQQQQSSQQNSVSSLDITPEASTSEQQQEQPIKLENVGKETHELPEIVKPLYTHWTTGIVVIYDTETTGLDIRTDDILQIHIRKYDKGKLIDQKTLWIKTNKEIPAYFADAKGNLTVENPLADHTDANGQIIEGEYNKHKAEHKDFATALHEMAEFCKEATAIIGHNSKGFDNKILRKNAQDKHGTTTDLDTLFSGKEKIDTLEIARKIDPAAKKDEEGKELIRAYSLENLRKRWDIKDEEQAGIHDARNDVAATASLIEHILDALLFEPESLVKRKKVNPNKKRKEHNQQLLEKWQNETEEAPTNDSNIRKAKIRKVIKLAANGCSYIFFEDGHIGLVRLNNSERWIYYSKKDNQGVDNTAQEVDPELVKWANNVIDTYPTFEASYRTTVYASELTYENISRVEEYSDGVVRIYDYEDQGKSAFRKPRFERTQSGQWIVYTDLPTGYYGTGDIRVASQNTNDKLDKFFETIKQSDKYKKKGFLAYGHTSINTVIADMNESNTEPFQDKTGIGLRDAETGQKFFFAYGRWRGQTNGWITNEEESRHLTLLAMQLTMYNDVPATYIAMMQDALLHNGKDSANNIYGAKVEVPEESDQPYAIALYMEQNGVQKVFARRTIDSMTSQAVWTIEDPSAVTTEGLIVKGRNEQIAFESFLGEIAPDVLQEVYNNKSSRITPRNLLIPHNTEVTNINRQLIANILFNPFSIAQHFNKNIQQLISKLQEAVQPGDTNDKIMQDVSDQLKILLNLKGITRIDPAHPEEFQYMVFLATQDVLNNEMNLPSVDKFITSAKNSYKQPATWEEMVNFFTGSSLYQILNNIDSTSQNADEILNEFLEASAKITSALYAKQYSNAYGMLWNILRKHKIAVDPQALDKSATSFGDVATLLNLNLFSNMPASLAHIASQLFNHVNQKNLLNRFSDPLKALDTFFNEIVPTWQEHFNHSDPVQNWTDARREDEFKKFFYREGEGTARFHQLYDDIFHSENDQNLKALQQFFKADPKVSLLYRFLEDLETLLQTHTADEVKSHFDEVSESIASMQEALNRPNSKNGNFFFLTKTAKGEVTWNRNLLVRAALGALSTYFILNQTENRREDKSSTPDSLFNNQSEVKEQVMGTIGYQAETDEHILRQIVQNVRLYLGIEGRGKHKKPTVEDAIINSIAKTMLAAMVHKGFFTKHTVVYHYSRPVDNQFTTILSEQIISTRSYLSANKKVYRENHTYGSYIAPAQQRRKHVFLTVNRATDSKETDLELYNLAGGMSSQLAFLLDNMILEKHNNNIAIGEENLWKPATEGTYYHSNEVLTQDQVDIINKLDAITNYINLPLYDLITSLGSEEDIISVFAHYLNSEYDEATAREFGNRMANEMNKGLAVGLATQVRDMMDIIQKLKNYMAARAAEGHPMQIDEIPIFLKHAATTMDRYMMTGGANTQTSKLLRELIISSKEPKAKKRVIDFNNRKQTHYLLRTIAAGFGAKPGQAKGLVSIGNQELRRMLLEKLPDSFFEDNTAWNAFKDMINGKNTGQSKKEIMKAFLDEVEARNIDADQTWLAINAFIELARVFEVTGATNISNLILEDGTFNTKSYPKDYYPNMYIENDGVSSGSSHAVHLYSTGAYTAQEILAKAAGGYSYIPGSYADAYNFINGNDLYVMATNEINNWFQDIFTGGANLSISDGSTALTDTGQRVHVRMAHMNQDGKIEYDKEGKEITPEFLLMSILNLIHTAKPNGFKETEKIKKDTQIVEALLEELAFTRSLIKDRIIQHNYEAGKKAITRNLVKEIIAPYLNMQTQHNLLIDQRNSLDPKSAEYKQLDAEAKDLRQTITKIGMYLQQACVVSIVDSRYTYEDSPILQSKAQFEIDNNADGLQPDQWLPYFNESTEMYDTSFSLGPKALDILIGNVQHMLIVPLVDKLETKVYPPSVIHNKKLLNNLSNVLGTLYEGIEAYFFAELVRQNNKMNTPISQKELDQLTERLAPLLPRLIQRITLESLPKEEGGTQDISFHREISLMREQMLSSSAKATFPDLFPEGHIDRTFQSGDSLLENNSEKAEQGNFVNPQASISLQGHTNPGAATGIMTVQGLAESAVIAAGALADLVDQDQFDGKNSKLDIHTLFNTLFNNAAVGRIWQNLNVFEVFLNTLEQFTSVLTNVDQKGNLQNADLIAIVKKLLSVQATINIEAKKKANNSKTSEEFNEEEEDEEENAGIPGFEADAMHDQNLERSTYRKGLNNTQYLGAEHYPDGVTVKYTSWQKKLAKALYGLATYAGYKDLKVGNLTIAETTRFMQMLIKPDHIEKTESMTEAQQKKIDEYNNELDLIEKNVYDPNLLTKILSAAHGELARLARDSEIRRYAWQLVGDTVVDQLNGFGQGAVLPHKVDPRLTVTDKNGNTLLYSPPNFFENVPVKTIDDYDDQGNLTKKSYYDFDALGENAKAIKEQIVNNIVNELNKVVRMIESDPDIIADLLTDHNSTSIASLQEQMMQVNVMQELDKLAQQVQHSLLNQGQKAVSYLDTLMNFVENNYDALTDEAIAWKQRIKEIDDLIKLNAPNTNKKELKQEQAALRTKLEYSNVIAHLLAEMDERALKASKDWMGNPFLKRTKVLTLQDNFTEENILAGVQQLYNDKELAKDFAKSIWESVTEKGKTRSGLTIIRHLPTGQHYQLIVINPSAIDNTALTRSEVILHEMMHASFDYYVQTYVQFSDDGTITVDPSLRSVDPNAYNMLRNIVDTYQYALPKIVSETLAKLSPVEQQNVNAIITKVFTTENITGDQRLGLFKEFVAYALSNRDFAKAMAMTSTPASFMSYVSQTREDIEASKNTEIWYKLSQAIKKFVTNIIDFAAYVFRSYFRNYSSIKPDVIEKTVKSSLNNLAWGFQMIVGCDSYGNFSFNQTANESTNISAYQTDTGTSIDRLFIRQERMSDADIQQIIQAQVDTFTSGVVTEISLFFPELQKEKAILEKTYKQWYSSLILQHSTKLPVANQILERYSLLAAEIAKYVKEDIFYPTNTPSEQEKIEAANKAQVILNYFHQTWQQPRAFSGYSSAVPLLLTLAQTNQKLQQKLVGVKLQSNKIEPGEHTVDNLLYSLGNHFNNLIKTITGDPITKPNANLLSALKAIDTKLDSTFDKLLNQGQYIPVNNWLNWADEKAIQQITNLIQTLSSSQSKSVQNISKVLKVIFDERTANNLKQEIRHTLNLNDNIPRVIKDLVTDILGTRLQDLPLYDLATKIKVQVDQLRQSYRKQIPARIRQLFKNSVTKKEWESLYTSLGSTGIYSLPMYAPQLIAQIPSFLSNNSAQLSSTISAYETKVKDQIKGSKRIANILAKTKQLGHYMATHEAGNFLLRNTWAIGMFYNGQINTALENDLSVLATLYAFQDLNQYDKEVLAKTWKNHEVAVKEVIQLIASIQEIERNKLKVFENMLNNQTAFSQNRKHEYYRIRMNAYQNYMPMESIEGSTMIIAESSREAELRPFGYTKQGDYTNSLDKRNQKMSYYYNTIPEQADFMEGAIVITAPTYNGIYTNTGQSLQGAEHHLIETNVNAITQQMAALGSTPQSTEGNDLIPVFNIDKSGAIQIIAYERSFNKKMNRVINKHYELADALGIIQGRQLEELSGQVWNLAIGSILIDEYNPMHTQEYVDIANENSLTVIQKDAVSRIPASLMDILQTQFEIAGYGRHIYIRKDLLKDAIGERKISIREAFNPARSDLNKQFLAFGEKCCKAMFGDQAYRIAVRGEEAVQGIVDWAKKSIVVRSVRLVMVNGFANIWHLNANGIPFSEIIREIPKIYSQCETYNKSFQELRNIELQIRMSTDPIEKRSLNIRKEALEAHIQSLSIYPIIDEFSVINELNRNSNDIKLTRGQWGEWFQEITEKYVPSPIRNAGRYVFMTQDTAIYQALEKATQYGDFIAKAILYNHWVKNKIYSPTVARRYIIEEFVNYNKQMGRLRQYLESVGIGPWFGNYMLRIMKTAERLIRNHPARALLHGALANPGPFVGDVGDVLRDSFLGRCLRGIGLNNFGWAFIKTAWDGLPVWWLAGLLL